MNNTIKYELDKMLYSELREVQDYINEVEKRNKREVLTVGKIYPRKRRN